jgi:sugar phosphate isomerase/epimerase
MDRRAFLGLAAAVPVLPAFGRSLQTIGVQCYTLRDVIPQKPDETFQALEKIGFREAELTSGLLEKGYPALKRTSIRPVSLHAGTDLFMRRQNELPAVLDNAKQRGFEYVICPYIAPADRGGPEMMRKLGESLTKAGELGRKAGIKIGYHNHAFEWQPTGKGTLLDVLLDASDPALVSLQLDIMWVTVGGHDAAATVAKYGKRISSIHIKNVAKGTGPRFNEDVPAEAFREVGDGVIDIAAVLRAGEAAGVKHYFIEQDQTKGDPLDALRHSFAFLKTLSY